MTERRAASLRNDRERGRGEQKKQIVPPELLEEVFELNMQLQELRLSRDEETVRALEEARKRFEKMMESLTVELKSLWNHWDAVITPPGHSEAERVSVRDKMVALLNRRSYFRNLVRDVNGALNP